MIQLTDAADNSFPSLEGLSLLEQETKADAILPTAHALLEGSLSQWDLNWWQNVVRCRHREVMTRDNVRSVPRQPELWCLDA